MMAYASSTPDFSGIFDAFQQGKEATRRSYLQDLEEKGRALTGQALGGDANALKELGGIDPNAYMNVSKFTTEQKAQRLDELAAGAMDADTPEKWDAFVKRAAAQGHTLGPGETRESIINEAMGWKEKLAQSNADRSYNLDMQQFGETKRAHRAQEDIERGKIAAASPDLVELFDEQTGQPYKARWNATTKQFDRVGGIKSPSGTEFTVTSPDGTVTSYSQGGKGANKPLTEGQSKDVAYLTRMTEAVPLIDQMGDKLTSLGENVGARVPLVGNYLKSGEYQQAEQAAGVWRQAFLRKDSGATITPDETTDTNRLYIPQPGDKAPVLAQKAKARRTATLAVKMGLPPKAVMEMQKAGIDVDQIIGAPLPGTTDGKSDQMPTLDEINQELQRRSAQ